MTLGCWLLGSQCTHRCNHHLVANLRSLALPLMEIRSPCHCHPGCGGPALLSHDWTSAGGTLQTSSHAQRKTVVKHCLLPPHAWTNPSCQRNKKAAPIPRIEQVLQQRSLGMPCLLPRLRWCTSQARSKVPQLPERGSQPPQRPTVQRCRALPCTAPGVTVVYTRNREEQR